MQLYTETTGRLCGYDSIGVLRIAWLVFSGKQTIFVPLQEELFCG